MNERHEDQMISVWFLKQNGRELGPFDSHAMRQMAANGELKKDDLVRSNDSTWVPASRVKGLRFRTAADTRLRAIEIEQFFRTLRPLIDMSLRQFLILMYEFDASIPCDDEYPVLSPEVPFEFALNETRDDSSGEGIAAGAGSFSARDLLRSLQHSGLISFDSQGDLVLSDLGREFAVWLIAKEDKAAYFQSGFGGWGERPPDLLNFDLP